MKSLYDLNPEFNEMLEEACGPVILGSYKFSPAKVLFQMDSEAYEQELSSWNEERRLDLLECAQETLKYGLNKKRFETLINILRKGTLIPFIGAGLSIPCGNPSWRDYLLKLSKKAKMDYIEIEKRLDKGEYEEVAEELIDKIGVPGFNEYFDNTFISSGNLRGSVLLLPELTRGCIVTTNVDTILEESFRDADCPFQEIVNGNQGNEFIRALASGDKHLLKLHGNLKTISSRVLTKYEYCCAYGSDTIDFDKSLPNALKRVFSHYCLLFLGCSLGPDRTMNLFHTVLKDIGESNIPRHYAILELPDDESKIDEREKFLNDRMIFPIWYPHEAHENVEALLTLMIESK